MIIAYCLSVHAINFFSLDSLQKFKLRLINQQTGDSTETTILNAKKIRTDDFPVSLNLKGSDKMLMKIKMLQIVTGQSDNLIGQGVINFTKEDVNNSLRVPIYDKKRGVEEVAICSIDFFVSGFLYDRNRNGNADKSRSRVQDWRQRSEEMVYSQMSYTLVSQQQRSQFSKSEKAKNKPIHSQKFKEPKKIIVADNKIKQNKIEQQKYILKQGEQYRPQKDQQSKKKQQNMRKIGSRQQNKLDVEQQQPYNSIPLQNAIYLSNNKQQQYNQGALQNIQLLSLKPKEQNTEQAIINASLKNLQKALHSIQNSAESQNSKAQSRQKLKQQIQQNQKLMKQLRQYLNQRRRQQQNRSKAVQQNRISPQKIRRKTVRIEQISAYKFQNNFIQYHIATEASRSPKIVKNIRAVKIINNELKQSRDEIIVDIPINKVQLYLMNDKKIVSLDAMGYRYFCVTNHIKQNSLEIKIPPQEKAVRADIVLQDEGKFQGVIGLQEGEQMAIYLTRKEPNIGKVLSKQQFKLYFDIKQQFSIKPINLMLEKNSNQMSFREPYEITSEDDIRKRVSSLSQQPWGYVKSYSEQPKGQNQQMQMLDKLKHKFSSPKKQDEIKKDNPLASFQRRGSVDKKINDKQTKKREQHKKRQQNFDNSEYSFLMKRFYTSDQNSLNQSVISEKNIKQSIKNSPIRKKIRKKGPQSMTEEQMSQANEIINIRNGNRNNYKYKSKSQQSQIKQLWQKLLIKKRFSKDKQDKKHNRELDNSPIILRNKKRTNLQSSFVKQSDLSYLTSKSSINIPEYELKKGNDSFSSEQQTNRKTKSYPLRSLTLQIKNISITEPQVQINQSVQYPVGKFIKISIKGKVQYFTEVIFNGEYNSILWKLEGCIFSQLNGSQKIQLQIYQAHDNQIAVVGSSFIRVSKLHFLRDNHIYNGKIMYNNMLNAEYTLGFNVVEVYPFEIIEQEEEQTTIKHLPNIYQPALYKSPSNSKQRRNATQQKSKTIHKNSTPNKKMQRGSRSLEMQELKKLRLVNNIRSKQTKNITSERNKSQELQITKKRKYGQ